MNVNSLLTAFSTSEINRMFGEKFVMDVEKKFSTKDIIKKCVEFLSYENPFYEGDIVEDECGVTYVVTCVYTDNTMDVMYATGDKRDRANIHPYDYDIRKVGELHEER